MELVLSPEDEAFRREVRAFLAEKMPPEFATRTDTGLRMSKEDHIRWQRILYDRGWIAASWPVEYGGTGWTAMQKHIFEEECALAGAPPLIPFGLVMVAPVLMAFGSQAQKDRYLPRILRSDDWWCQGYSEPGSGSDLASLRTKAVRDGDHYVVTGQKTWTTLAQHADMMFTLVRTSDTGKPQEGITFLLIDMHAPGVTVQPITTLDGSQEINSVFLDAVRVPVENRVGEEGKGWTYGKYLLELERGSGIASAKLRDALKTVADLAESDATGRAIDDPDIAVRMSEIEVDIDTLEMTELRVLSALQTGQNPGAVSSLLKLRVSEIRQAVTRLGVEVIGNDGLYVEPMRPLYRLNEAPGIPEEILPVVPEYLNGRAYTIFGGSSEIQREIVAKMVLGL